MKALVRLVAVLAAAAAIAAAATPQAQAATSYPINQTFSVLGYNVNIAGTATLTSFQVSGNTISASATFVGTGTVTDPTTGATLLQFPINATLTGTVTIIDADCATGTLTFDVTATLTLSQPLPANYTVGPVRVTIAAGDNQKLHNLICQIDTLLNNGASLNSVADKLNVLLKKA